MTLTLLLLSLGLVTLYSASAFLAQGQAYPDYYYVLRQATGAAAGLAVLGLVTKGRAHGVRHTIMVTVKDFAQEVGTDDIDVVGRKDS